MALTRDNPCTSKENFDARGVQFNLGDCLKILAYHDALHIGQAQRVLADAREHNV